MASRLPTCVLTVASLTNRAAAISVLLPPRASSTSTSRSRAVSEASRAGEGAASGGRRANASIRRRVTVGASSALPAAAARTAAIRSARGESLSRKPLAPARSASYTYSSRSKVVSMTTLGGVRSARAAGEPPGGLEPVHARHADVHQHHVGVVGVRRGQRRLAVGGLPHHRDAVGGLQDDAESRADQFLVVDHQHPDQVATGSRAVTAKSSSPRLPRGPGEAVRLGSWDRADGQVAAAGGHPFGDPGQPEAGPGQQRTRPVKPQAARTRRSRYRCPPPGTAVRNRSRSP